MYHWKSGGGGILDHLMVISIGALDRNVSSGFNAQVTNLVYNKWESYLGHQDPMMCSCPRL